MSLAAGKLNRRITIQRRDSTQDAAGQPAMTWVDVTTVWAHILGDNGLRTIHVAGDIPLSVKRYSFRIRYLEGIDEGMRVLYNGTPFDIRAVRMDYAGREWTDLVCEEGASNG